MPALVKPCDVGAGRSNPERERRPPFLERRKADRRREHARLNLSQAGRREEPSQLTLARAGKVGFIAGLRVGVVDTLPEPVQRPTATGLVVPDAGKDTSVCPGDSHGPGRR